MRRDERLSYQHVESTIYRPWKTVACLPEQVDSVSVGPNRRRPASKVTFDCQQADTDRERDRGAPVTVYNHWQGLYIPEAATPDVTHKYTSAPASWVRTN